MKGCAQARKLFGPYWDDEVTQAEREWVERHLAGCDHCREEYDSLARTIEAVASLPRAEVSAGFAERALAAARRASPAPDRLPAQPLTPRWVPVTAVAALVVIALASVAPYLASLRSNGTVASRDVAAPRRSTACSIMPTTWSSSSIP